MFCVSYIWLSFVMKMKSTEDSSHQFLKLLLTNWYQQQIWSVPMRYNYKPIWCTCHWCYPSKKPLDHTLSTFYATNRVFLLFFFELKNDSNVELMRDLNQVVHLFQGMEMLSALHPFSSFVHKCQSCQWSSATNNYQTDIEGTDLRKPSWHWVLSHLKGQWVIESEVKVNPSCCH